MFTTKVLTTLAMATVLTLFMMEPTFAAPTAGESLYSGILEFLKGTPGKVLALILGVAGLWTWLVGQSTAAGISMILAGILILFAPRIVGGAAEMLQSPLETMTTLKNVTPNN